MAETSKSRKQVSGEPRKLKSRVSRVLDSTRNQDVVDQLETKIAMMLKEQRELNKRAVTLQKRNLQLAELNLAKEEFIAIASHQLRTPATGVKQYVRLLLDGYADPLTENQKFFLERAHESNDRQLKIIDDLLQVARIDSSDFKLTLVSSDVALILDDVVTELAKKAHNRHQKINYRVPRSNMIARVDPSRLRMVFENLIDNALNYSIDGSSVTVSLGRRNNKLSVTIRDEGVGISRVDYSKLFQKFSRIPNDLSIEAGGTGLGLYWAHRIVSLHNGSIVVSSRLGRGSAFTVKIPADQ